MISRCDSAAIVPNTSELLARAGDAGEHRQPALRDLDADVLEVVLARAMHADQIVAVGNVRRRQPRVHHRGYAHRVSIYLQSRLRGLRRRASGSQPAERPPYQPASWVS